MKFSGLTIVAPRFPKRRATYDPAKPPPRTSVPPRASRSATQLNVSSAPSYPFARRRERDPGHPDAAEAARRVVPAQAGADAELVERVGGDDQRRSGDAGGVLEAVQALAGGEDPARARDGLPRRSL